MLFNFSNIWALKKKNKKLIFSSYGEIRLYDLLKERIRNIFFITYPEKRWRFDKKFFKRMRVIFKFVSEIGETKLQA